MQARRSAALRALELAQQELNQTKPLLATGAVSQVDILRLDREVSRNLGRCRTGTGADRPGPGRHWRSQPPRSRKPN